MNSTATLTDTLPAGVIQATVVERPAPAPTARTATPKKEKAPMIPNTERTEDFTSVAYNLEHPEWKVTGVRHHPQGCQGNAVWAPRPGTLDEIAATRPCRRCLARFPEVVGAHTPEDTYADLVQFKAVQETQGFDAAVRDFLGNIGSAPATDAAAKLAARKAADRPKPNKVSAAITAMLDNGTAATEADKREARNAAQRTRRAAKAAAAK